MNEKLLHQLLHERISLLHGEKLTIQDKDIMDAGEQAIKDMPEEGRNKVEAYLSLLEAKDMDSEARAYTEGFKDAVWFLDRLNRIRKEQADDDDK